MLHLLPFDRNPNFRSRATGKPLTGPQRRSAVGRDCFGNGFKVGDRILASVDSRSKVLEVEEIFLDDSTGCPYYSYGSHPYIVPTLAFHLPSGEVFSTYYRRGKTVTVPIDPTWLGSHLGLVSFSQGVGELSDDFKRVYFQSFRVQARPVGSDAGAKSMSIPQDRIAVFDMQLTPEELERLTYSLELPVLHG